MHDKYKKEEYVYLITREQAQALYEQDRKYNKPKQLPVFGRPRDERCRGCAPMDSFWSTHTRFYTVADYVNNVPEL